MKNKVFYAAIVFVSILAIGSVVRAYALTQSIKVEGDYVYNEAEAQSAPTEQTLGAFPGGDIYDDVNIYGSLSYGGESYIATSTVATTYTVVEKDLQPYRYVDLMVNTGATTFTLPATSTMMNLLPSIGSTREWLFHNATSSAGITLTLAAGAGMDLVGVTTDDDVIDEGEWTRLTCSQIYYRTADNENIMCIVDELADVD